MTLACWFFGAPAARGLVSIATAGSANNRFSLTCGSASPYTVIATTRTTGSSSSTTAATILANTWGHAAGVFASTTSRIAYANGTAATEETTSRSPTAPTAIFIGATDDTATIINASIMWPAIWNAALTASEIALLASGVSPLNVRRESLVQFWEWTGNPVEYGINPAYPLSIASAMQATAFPGSAIVTPRPYYLGIGNPTGGAASAIPVFMHHYQQQGIA